jgi:murein L,D-transpeptidase YafK
MQYALTRIRQLLGNLRAGLLLVTLLGAVTAFGSLCLPAAARAGSGELWLLVDTRSLTLSVLRGEMVLFSYDNIAIGSNGATWNKRVGDEKTPRGDFRILEIRPSERFHLFLSLAYPNMDHAERAFSAGRLGAEQYERIKKAWAGGDSPPQDTRLGGYIGIHGVGRGSLEIHGNFNWTDGCIALTNEQVEDLADRVQPGTRVRIR